MVQNIRGEMTVLDTFQHSFSLKDSIFIKTIANALHISTSKVHHTLFSTILHDLCTCVHVHICVYVHLFVCIIVQ